MSHQLRGFLGSLFGSTDKADCCVCFHVASEAPPRSDSSPTFIGEPLSAHQLVLRGGSERFRAHIERWAPLEPGGDGGAGRGHKRIRLSLDPCPDDDQRTGGRAIRVRLSVDGGWSSSSSGGDGAIGSVQGSASPNPNLNRPDLPRLLVPLDSEDELQPSLEAVRFMYTGSLKRQGQAQRASAGELVLIRRQAEYLQVHGCAEACDKALVQCFKRTPSGSGIHAGSSNISSSSPLAPALELYSCRHLLPSPEDDPRVRTVLAACRQCLVANWGAPLPDGEDQPSKAEILAWLLGGGDAVRIANDEELLQLWRELPVAALEGLLQSDHLSTDDEATVVLLVEVWVAAQGSGVTEADKARVRGQLRLVNCSTSYLFDVLPKLPWLGPNPAQQAAFMARCRLTGRSQWERLGGVMMGYDTSSPWYGKPRPQSVPEEGVSYSWEVSREDLLAGLRKEGDVKHVYARFQLAETTAAVAYGVRWVVCMCVQCTGNPPNASADLHFACFIPSIITVHTGEPQHGGCCTSACLSLRAPATDKWVVTEEVAAYGHGMGGALLLERGPGGQPAGGEQQQQGPGGQAAGGGAETETEAELLAPWAKLLGPEGKIRGELKFSRPGA